MSLSGLASQLPTLSTPRTHSFRLDFTTQLSSAQAPSGTSSYGMLGIWQSFVVSSFSAFSISAFRSSLAVFISATLAFTASASSFLPCFMRPPISAASFLASDRFLSNCVCAARRFLSVSITSAMASRAPAKRFFSRPAITRSVSSVISFNVSILFWCFYISAVKLQKNTHIRPHIALIY